MRNIEDVMIIRAQLTQLAIVNAFEASTKDLMV
jgi:hypothetical protein